MNKNRINVGLLVSYVPLLDFFTFIIDLHCKHFCNDIFGVVDDLLSTKMFTLTNFQMVPNNIQLSSFE